MSAARVRLFATAILLFSAPLLWSLDVSQGRIKLTLHEGIGRFSIAYLTDVKSGTFKSFLSDQDPRTSVLSVAVGNKVYRMGESSEFKETVQKTSDGAGFTWTSASLVATEAFTFTTSKGSPLADGIRIDLTLKNATDHEVNLGVRYLFDTYLGEQSYVHFKTDKVPQIDHELTLTKADGALYWISPLVGDPNQFGLMAMLSGEGVSTPDRVVFANWKRLNEASWGYETSGSRTFSLLPYSVNDSAVCHYFDPKAVPAGGSLHIVTILGHYSPAGFAAQGATPASVAEVNAVVTQQLEASKDIQDANVSVQTDLSAVNRLIDSINAKLSSGQPITDQELATMSQLIAELKERSAKFKTSTSK